MATRTRGDRATRDASHASASGASPSPRDGTPESPLVRLLSRAALAVGPRTTRWTDAAVLAGALGLLVWFLEPDLLLADTTAAAGDTGAHIYAPWFLKNHLLSEGRVAGWSPDWFGGFPLLHFYFPVVPLLQVLLSFLIPSTVAFKLGTVVGPLFFPIAVYVFFRLLRFPWPLPAVAVVMAVRFLFMYSFTNYGGNLASSLVGEYSFSLSLGLALVFLGLCYRLATEATGRPVLAAVVLAVAALSHLLPIIGLVAPVAPLLFFWAARERGVRAAAGRFAAVFGVAIALSAFWSVPFLARLGWAAELSVTPLSGFDAARPSEMWLYIPLLPTACLLGLIRRDRRVLMLAVPALWGLVLFKLTSVGSIWNARYLPFWFLGILLCSAYAVGTLIPAVVAWMRERRLAVAAAIAIVAILAGFTTSTILRHDETDFVKGIVTKSYGGYENAPRHETFEALMARIAALPPGRVAWEPSLLLQEFGTIHSLATIPYWADHPTINGLYVESSISSPFIYALNSEVGDRYRRLPQWPYDSGFALERAVPHMQVLDVSYFVSTTDDGRAEAQRAPGLTHVADVDEVSIFAVEPSGAVVIPEFRPVVLDGAEWIDENLEWFAHVDEMEVPLVADGPQEWERIEGVGGALPRVPVEGGGRAVEDVVTTDDTISFTTDAVGEPHWVKTSYFPNWSVEGAKGPYLASPSMMMVVPTRPNVTLSYGRTWAEWSGLLLTLLAIGSLIVPASRRAIARAGGAVSGSA